MKTKELVPTAIGIRLQGHLSEKRISHKAGGAMSISYANKIGEKIGDTYVRDVCIGRIRDPGGKRLEIVAATFGLNPDWLERGTGNKYQNVISLYADDGKSLPSIEKIKNPLTSRPTIETSGETMPMYGAKTADGTAIDMNQLPVDLHFPVPDELRGRRDVFAMQIIDSLMWPQLWLGRIAHIDPHGVYKEGDAVAIEMLSGGCILRRFFSRAGGYLICGQFNPPRDDIKIPEAEIKRVMLVKSSTHA